MVHKRLLRPERRRRVPSQFSWVDHRLVREHHIERLSCEACALYLFLVTVGDADGLSYYADASVGQRLHLDQAALELARRALVAADLIAYEPPLYQVLSLEAAAPRQPRSDAANRCSDNHGENPDRRATANRQAGARHLAEILRDLEVRR